MATIPATTVPNPNSQGEYDRVMIKKWVLSANSEGAKITLPNHADRSIQINGVFNGAAVTIQNTIDGENWVTLRDIDNNPLRFESTPLYTPVISPATLSIRALVCGGDASTEITVHILAKG
jgi:hypothetical protein